MELTCPGCDRTFQHTASTRPPIYCDSVCKKKNRTLKRYCLNCGTDFFLTEDQPTATTTCSLECKVARDLQKKEERYSHCELPGCNEPTPIYTEMRMQPVFCTEAHAQAYFDACPLERKICAATDCTNQVKFEVHRLRRPQRFCSDTCRQQAHGHERTSTKQKIKAGKKVRMSGMKMPVLMITPSKRVRWNELTIKTRTKLEQDGWTRKEWETHPGHYSKAALRGEIAHIRKED